MTVALIVLVQVTVRVVVDRERHALEIQQDAASTVAAIPGTTYVDVNDAISRGCPPPCVVASGPFDSDLRTVLLPGSHIVSDRENGMIWVRYSSTRY
jgi:hypothetical protein